MRSTSTGLTLMVLALASLMMGCNPLNKMNKKHGLVKYNLTPNPLELHGDSIDMTVSGRYPEKFFHKKAVAKVTPVFLDAKTGNVVKEFESIKLIGEAAEGEGEKISWSGGSFNMSKKIPYETSMRNVKLEVRIEAGYKTKTKTFDPVPLGYGTITTPLWVQSDEMPILGKDAFTQTSPRSIKADINYSIQSSVVRPQELRADDINAVRAFMDKGIENEYTWKNVSITAYASPDGEMALNENLANDRATSAANAMKGLFRAKKIDAGKADALYTKVGKGEDWKGFQEKMKASDIADKDMILRILSTYSDDKKRETEIKNLAATYVVIAEQILPPLRRSMISISAEEAAKTPEELKSIVKSNPSELTIEEILYTATLYNDLNEKLQVYKAAEKTYPEDWRTSNNVGYILVLQNKVSEAKGQFDKAYKADGTAKPVLNNLGVTARLMGDRSMAMDYYTKAKGAGSEVNYNIGILNIMSGNYSDAVSNMGSNNTFNSALAKVLNGNNDGGLNTVEASNAKATAEGYYLKAIIGARMDNKEMCMNNLKSAIEKDASLKGKAASDAEFQNYADDEAFKAMVN